MNPLDQKNAENAKEDGCGAKKPRDVLSRRSVPKLLKKSAGGENCCIFRIPRRPEDNNQKDYEPRLVSIGPYHHGKKHLQMIQEHKQGYLEFFMAEARKNGVEMEDLIEAVSLLEEDIQDSYSENLELGDALIDMMVLDGCFILMLFLVVANKVKYTESDDPIFRSRWILPAIRKDLLLLENQVPFFLLQTLFEKSKIVTSGGLNEITFEFFSYSIEKLDKFSSEHHKIKAKHLLDLIRNTFMPRKESQESVSRRHVFLKLIHSAKNLRLQGIKFRPRNNAETLLDVGLKMEMGIVEIPPIALDEFLISVFRNCVAFEQFYGDCTNPITSYIAFMGCLIKNEADAEHLTEMGIIENNFGTGEDISEIFNDIGKDISFDLHESYLADVFKGVNRYTARPYNAWKGVLMHKYFADPWKFYSVYSGLMLLILTIMQVYLAAYPYIHPPKDK